MTALQSMSSYRKRKLLTNCRILSTLSYPCLKLKDHYNELTDSAIHYQTRKVLSGNFDLSVEIFWILQVSRFKKPNFWDFIPSLVLLIIFCLKNFLIVSNNTEGYFWVYLVCLSTEALALAIIHELPCSCHALLRITINHTFSFHTMYHIFFLEKGSSK